MLRMRWPGSVRTRGCAKARSVWNWRRIRREACLWSLKYWDRVFWLTQKARDLFGLSPHEALTYDQILSMVHPEDRELVRETVQTVVQSKKEGRVQYRIFRPDGSLRWMSTSGRVPDKSSGEPSSLMGVVFDITEQKQAEAAVRENEARLASAIDVASLGFYEIAEKNRVTFLDDRARNLLGVPQGEDHLTFDYWKERLHPADRQHVLDIVRDIARASLDKTATEYRYRHPQHGVLWFNHLTRVLERNASGVPIKRIGVIQDITERKKAEEELKRLRLQLWHADRVAQTGAITASLAHELNQPLAAILTNAQAGLRFMAGENPDLEEIREILTDIVHDDKRAGAVISGLRDHAAPQGNRARDNQAGGHDSKRSSICCTANCSARQVQLRPGLGARFPGAGRQSADPASDSQPRDERRRGDAGPTRRAAATGTDLDAHRTPAKRWWPSAIRARAFPRISRRRCSRRSGRPSSRGWGSACRSPAPSSNPTGVAFGLRTTRTRASLSTSRFPS